MSSEKSKFFFFFVRNSEINQIEEILNKKATKVDGDFGTRVPILDNGLLIEIKDSFECGDTLGLAVRDTTGELVGLIVYDIDHNICIHILGVYTNESLYEEIINQVINYFKNKYRITLLISLPETLDPVLLKKLSSKMKYLYYDEDGITYDATNHK